jgi:diguanylate cyclase (GGDEF)-like protein
MRHFDGSARVCARDNRLMNASEAESRLLLQLTASVQQLEAGKVEEARALAASVLKAATDSGDRRIQGKALLALAQFDRALGRFRRAIEASQRAVHLFRLDGDIASEAAALSLLAHASSILGRDAEAVEAALLSVRLGELLPPGSDLVRLQNYLGVAYLWSKSFANAQTALQESERLALLYAPTSDVLLPRTNLAWLEVMRLSKERYFTGSMPSTALLRERLAACTALFDDGVPFHALPGVRAVLQRFARSSLALCECWEGHLEEAHDHWLAAQDNSQPARYAQVANVISHWVLAELSWARHDLESARRHAAVLIELAAVAEFEQMAYVGHLLMTQLFRAEGRHLEALDEERRHRRRELRVRSEILDSRHAVVQTHLDMRSSEQHLQLMAQHSTELERLSFEDSLTGIANRRRFDLRLSEALRIHGATHPLCVALIDLNDFKSVNDTYSHAAGDDVLRTIGRSLREVVRDVDLAARIGGDEFAILFPNTPFEVAQMACLRIHARVAELSWSHVSPALRIEVSIGLAQSVADDTPESLLRRSDTAMFQAKALA